MRGGAVPPALLFAALGLALGYLPRRSLPLSLATAAVLAVVGSLLHPPEAAREAIFTACWISVVVAAVSVHLPASLLPRVRLLLSANTGLWAGLVVAMAGQPSDLLKASPLLLLCLPASWAVGRGYGVAVKVVASWLIAIALLAMVLPLTTVTPGYAPDHMG